MLKLKRFVSNKNIVIYTLIYGGLRILYLIAPLISKNFIDSSVDKDINNMKMERQPFFRQIYSVQEYTF